MDHSRLTVTASSNNSRRLSKARASGNSDAAHRRRKSRSPSRTRGRGKHTAVTRHSDPFTTTNPFTTNRALKLLSEETIASSHSAYDDNFVAAESSDDASPSVAIINRGKRPRALVPSSSRLLENSRKSNEAESFQHDRKSVGDQGAFTFSAMADLERLRKENEVLKQTVSDGKKVLKKREKNIEELKDQLSRQNLAKKDQDAELQSLKTKHNAQTQLVGSIESSIQCQICMEILAKPYALSPCGHVLCVSCLSEWFRKAPQADDDVGMDMDDPEYIMHRDKTCPCCRATVIRRPVPIFVIKSIASLISKAKDADKKTTGARELSSPSPADEDPWKDIFPDDDDDFYSAEDDDDDDYDVDYDSEDFDDEESEDGFPIPGPMAFRRLYEGHMMYESDEEPFSDGSAGDEAMEGVMNMRVPEEDEDSDEEDRFMPAQWEPPVVRNRYLVNELEERHGLSIAQMLMRGCTMAMIQNYNMEYFHHAGLVAHVMTFDHTVLCQLRRPGPNTPTTVCHRIFLGWRVDLSPHDLSGDGYIGECLQEIEQQEPNWGIEPRIDRETERPLLGLLDAQAFVYEENIAEYDTSDTDEYLV